MLDDSSINPTKPLRDHDSLLQNNQISFHRAWYLSLPSQPLMLIELQFFATKQKDCSRSISITSRWFLPPTQPFTQSHLAAVVFEAYLLKPSKFSEYSKCSGNLKTYPECPTFIPYPAGFPLLDRPVQSPALMSPRTITLSSPKSSVVLQCSKTLGLIQAPYLHSSYSPVSPSFPMSFNVRSGAQHISHVLSYSLIKISATPVLRKSQCPFKSASRRGKKPKDSMRYALVPQKPQVGPWSGWIALSTCCM